MKKILSIFTAAAVAAACAAAASADDRALVVLGDSITSGYGLDGYVSGDNYSAVQSFATGSAGNSAATKITRWTAGLPASC